MTRARCWARLGPIAMAFFAAGGCGPNGATDEEAAVASAAPEAETIRRSTTEGPVTAVVTLAPKEPRLGDALILTLAVEAAPGVTVEMPAFGEALGRFTIVDFTPRREARPDGSTVASQRYTLQAPMSGRQRIPPLRIEFVDERGKAKDGATGAGATGDGADSAPAEVRELLTDELGLLVASVLPEGAVADELRPPRGPLSPLPTETLRRWWPWLLLALAALGAAFAWRPYRRWARERVRATAHDIAMARLAKLEGRGFPAPAELDAWYVELSAIVRRYLEDRYAVRAPELTTEEFLREARRSQELTAPHRDLLSGFLERCDRVKFAAYQPTDDESREVLGAARRFLFETRLVKDVDQPARAAA